MGTYTWVSRSSSSSGAVTSRDFPAMTLDAVPGAIWKRMILRGTIFQVNSTGRDYRAISPWSWRHSVTVFREGHADKEIYKSLRGLPFSGMALYDSVTSERIYTQYFWAGDNEIGFERKISYGKSTDTEAPALQYNGSIFGGIGAGYSQDAVGMVNFEFAALYYTLT